MKSAATSKERRKSFGIGGAGNIRTKEEALVDDLAPSSGQERRRSSVWSRSSGASGEASSGLLSKVKNALHNSTSKKDSSEENSSH
ncbi:hypothetical protein SCUP234_05404 [Seiridium cupressi]